MSTETPTHYLISKIQMDEMIQLFSDKELDSVIKLDDISYVSSKAMKALAEKIIAVSTPIFSGSVEEKAEGELRFLIKMQLRNHTINKVIEEKCLDEIMNLISRYSAKTTNP